MHKNGPNTIFIMRVQCHGKSAVFARAGEGGGEIYMQLPRTFTIGGKLATMLGLKNEEDTRNRLTKNIHNYHSRNRMNLRRGNFRSHELYEYCMRKVSPAYTFIDICTPTYEVCFEQIYAWSNSSKFTRPFCKPFCLFLSLYE